MKKKKNRTAAGRNGDVTGFNLQDWEMRSGANSFNAVITEKPLRIKPVTQRLANYPLFSAANRWIQHQIHLSMLSISCLFTARPINGNIKENLVPGGKSQD